MVPLAPAFASLFVMSQARDFSHRVGKFALLQSLKPVNNSGKSRQNAGIGVAE